MNEIQKVEDINQEVVDTEVSLVKIESSRAMQEIQAAVISAKKFPRDMIQAERRIMEACKRKALAEQAMYAYNRGGAMVTGPSIRLAEVLAQNWGNLSCGITELEQNQRESTMMAFCVDLETNYRKVVTFNVKNEKHSKKGIRRLTDPRDIYENNFNLGARRLRSCILAVIPGDIIEGAVATCERTLAGDKTEPIADKIKKMLGAFESIGVSKDMLEKRLSHKLDATIMTEIVALGKIYKSLQDGMSQISDWFSSAAESNDKAAVLTDKYKTKEVEMGKQADKAPPVKSKAEVLSQQTMVDEMPPFDEFEGSD